MHGFVHETRRAAVRHGRRRGLDVDMHHPDAKVVAATGDRRDGRDVRRTAHNPAATGPDGGSRGGLAHPNPACMAPVEPLFHPLPSYADAAGSSLHQRGGTRAPS